MSSTTTAAAAAATSFCCHHPTDRTASPSPPPRPIANLDGIFAAAALPDDHPHALTFQHRAPEVNTGIVCSPGLGSKLKLQFSRRRSKMSLAKEKDCEGWDEDARVVSTREMMREVDGGSGSASGRAGKGAPPMLELRRFGSMSPITSEDCERLVYLKPAVKRSEDEADEASGTAGLANVVATYQPDAMVGCGNQRPLPPLPKSFSAPLLPCADAGTSPSTPIAGEASSRSTGALLTARRSRSDSDLAGAFRRQSDQICFTAGSSDGTGDASAPASADTPAIPILHVREPTREDLLESPPADQLPELKQKPSDRGLHLYNMGISQQLRSMSQLSDVAEDDSMPASPHPWTFHYRERSDLGPGRRPRQMSSSGVNSGNVPSSWGRVRSPGVETASSVYSRPTSAGASAVQITSVSETPGTETPVPAIDMNALFADWPLKTSKPSASRETSKVNVTKGSQRSGGSAYRDKPLPSTPGENRKDSGTASFHTAANSAGDRSVRWSSPPEHHFRVPPRLLYSALAYACKDDQPVRKTVKKRRSIFKFLRPGSRKQQHAPSTFTMSEMDGDLDTPEAQMGVATTDDDKISPAKNAGHENLKTYDGQSEDPALLTVQYELDERPSRSTRSVSMIDFGAAANEDADTLSQLPISTGLQRRPTHADYERNLSVIGDDRRRPSVINLQSAMEVEKDDHRDSVGIRRRISRARPLKDDANPLMAQALEKHQQEKALFRSASKQRESLNPSQTVPVFKSSPFSSGVPTPDTRSELLDPLGNDREAGLAGRSVSSTHLAVPSAATYASSGVSSTAGASRAGPRGSGSSSLRLGKKRIGTSLESWSRYPSHNRGERCASAGRPDNVITRDFAVDVDHADIHETDETEAEQTVSPGSKRTNKAKRSKAPLPKSRSMTFSSIVRYYSNLFSSSSVGQNRRTSVTLGGRLEYPELELLPPQLAAEPVVHPHHKHSGALGRFKEHAREDADKLRELVREEEDKVEEYVHEEEEKLETFVRREEDLVEGFVKKEEGKLKDYVRAEEDKIKKEEGKLKQYVRAEEDKFKHHRWRHHSSDRESTGRESPFREISLFEVPRDRSQDSAKRRDTMAIGPMDDLEDEGPTPGGGSVTTDAGLKLDGASHDPTEIEVKPTTPSKAELWSDIYRQCLTRPSSSSHDTTLRPPADPSRSSSMPPPALKPVKARSPEQPKQTDPNATIRRFPSVTVIDDRKGHFRSISLISVKGGKEAGFERGSTGELVELVKERERGEEKKLVGTAGGTGKGVAF
ncbi:uncharacterized protein LTR77_010438 [Saxophila tyrrhenica]|uniref:Uncharacterized protein n=1 Tax=Saxophila tyrrhenica TaxID=1690608 RepID=A0AAV9NVD8_9PEZI|nr:hypothetical protein LTR77_010438 [Saxophila tyrrhenica]